MIRKEEREHLQKIIDLRIEQREFIKKYYLEPLKRIIELTRGAYAGKENLQHVIKENERFSKYFLELTVGNREVKV